MANGKPGRPKGLPKTGGRVASKNTIADIRQMILNSLEQVGGEDYFRRQAEENPNAYMSLIGKVLPRDTTISGPDGGPVQHSVNIRFDD